jgi:glycosyltransferase involved in cell wall biosynthesis
MSPPTRQNPPRVLVLTNNKVQPFTGGGVVLQSLFHRFPRENIFVVHTDSTEGGSGGYSEHELDSLRFRLADAPRLLRMLALASTRLSRSVRRSDLVQLVVQSCRFRIPSALDREIRRFDPQAIYAWAGDSVWARLVEECAARYRIPYVIHFMDNHVELSGTNAIQGVVHAEYRRNLARVVSKAKRIFTISPAMGMAYREKFNKTFEVFHGVMDKKGWEWPDPPASSEPFTIAFTGSVESGQLGGLRDVAAAVDQLVKRGRKVRLVLYLTEFYEARARQTLGEFENVEYVRHPDAFGLRKALTAANALVLAYGFDKPCVEYYRYSFATKVVPYMLSGRCILAYGPLAIEPIAYVQRGGWGEMVSEQGVDKVERAIEALMDSPDKCRRLARSAYEAALEEHDLDINATRFVAAMTDVADA